MLSEKQLAERHLAEVKEALRLERERVRALQRSVAAGKRAVLRLRGRVRSLESVLGTFIADQAECDVEHARRWAGQDEGKP